MYYHGSNGSFPVLRRHKAMAPAGAPSGESLNAIYFSPDIGFALTMAAGPEGRTVLIEEKRTVHFENQDKFDPEKEVYIYIVDPSKIPDDKKILVDKWQVAVDLDEITPDRVEKHKAGELIQYYSIIGE